MSELTEEQKSMCDISYLTSRKKLKNNSDELKIQKDITDYVKTHYPKVYFISDALGLHTSWGIKQILLQTNSEHKHLDIVILKKSICGKYNGLVMEVKKETPFQKDGNIKKSPEDHLQKQLAVILMLRLDGYKAEFVWSLDQAVKLLNAHLGEPEIDNIPLF